MSTSPALVLFDLDGTLIDSAPDLAGAANVLRQRRSLPEQPYAELRPMVGSGARGMVGRALGLQPGDDGFEAARDEFLAAYEGMLLQRTQIFDAILPVLQALDDAGRPWGIVTNKAMRYAEPVIAGLGLHRRAVVCVCGDTTPFSKPHPEPLLAAARQAGHGAADCVYVGDDARDIEAGRAAGMATIAAAWGYLGAGAGPDDWGADHVFQQPAQLLHWLGLP